MAVSALWVLRNELNGIIVSTVWLGMSSNNPPRMFETQIRNSPHHKGGYRRFASTFEQAVAVHQTAINNLKGQIRHASA